jgi:hypothetical protein
MLDHNILVVVVSKILGHANPSVTLTIYAHSNVEMQTDAANIMDAIVTPVPVDLRVREAVGRKPQT